MRMGKGYIICALFRLQAAFLALSLLSARCHGISLYAVFDIWTGSTSHVLDDDGMLWSWGRNAEWQLADGTTNASVNALKLALPEGVTRWKSFEAGAAFAVIDDQDRLHGWGRTETPWSAQASIQRTPYLLSELKWKQIAIPSIDSGLPGVPWSLGILESGELRWIRIRDPLAPGDAPFSNRAIEPVDGVDSKIKFQQVVAGRHMYLALTESGQLYACGVGAWGVLGPNGDVTSNQFLTAFVEVEPPPGSGGWKRIAVADTQSFGWTESDELYVWGRRFEGQSNLNWEWVTDSTPRRVSRAPNQSPWVLVDGFGESQPSTLLLNAAGELWAAGDGFSITTSRQLRAMPGDWSPVQSFSVGGRHSLYFGSDGLVHAIGNNEDYQLGGFPGGDFLEQRPVIPGGIAPFLLGTPAEVPELSLNTSEAVIMEPVTGSGVAGAGVSVYVRRQLRPELGVFVYWEIQLRRMDGSIIEEPENAMIVGEILSGTSRLLYLGPDEDMSTITLVPRRALKYDEDLWIDLRLRPHPSYSIAPNSTITFHYKHTVPSSFPPEVTVVWPSPSQTLYVGEYLGVVFRVVDRDGYARVAQFTGDGFAPFGDALPRSMQLDPVPPGVEREYEVRIPRKSILTAFGPELTIEVIDDAGEKARVDLGVLNTRVTGVHQLEIRSGQGTQRLDIGTVGRNVVLESSTNLREWKQEAAYTFPSPGLPKTGVDVSNGNEVSRFYRLRNVK